MTKPGSGSQPFWSLEPFTPQKRSEKTQSTNSNTNYQKIEPKIQKSRGLRKKCREQRGWDGWTIKPGNGQMAATYGVLMDPLQGPQGTQGSEEHTRRNAVLNYHLLRDGVVVQW